jgi:hypothetical protein
VLPKKKKWDSSSEIPNTTKGYGVAKVVEYLPNKCETPSTATKKKKITALTA